MPVQLEIREIKPHTMQRAKKSFSKLLKATKDVTPVWKLFLSWYRDSFVKDVFKSRGGAMGKTWAAYSPSYRVWRKKNAGGKSKLRLSDRLYDAATGGASSFEKMKNKSLTFGIDNDIKYAGVHQYGSSKQGIPQRPYLFSQDGDLPPRAWAFLARTMDNYLEGSFNGD